MSSTICSSKTSSRRSARGTASSSGAVGHGDTGAQDASPKRELSGLSGRGAPCPAEYALADLVLEFEEHAALRLRSERRSTGAEISVTGDTMVMETAGEDLDLPTETAGNEDGPAVGPGAEETPRWRRAPRQGQAPPGDGGDPSRILRQRSGEPAAELPDDGPRRQRD